MPLATKPFSESGVDTIGLRPINDGDLEFLFRLYACTRTEEKALVNWPDEQWEQFLRMQFNFQHRQYMSGYHSPSFDIIMEANVPVGRLYIDRKADDYRLIDIALLPDFRRRGIAGALLKALLMEADSVSIPVSLHVEKNNPVLDYYQRLGFRISENKEVYYFMVRPPTTGKDAA
ncbi:MAG: GNAT family N-acetyltransferase [Geobacteraceae bacterium]|nr:GNAT family N-acetyltransferase [Geobacteraceae bacterium]